MFSLTTWKNIIYLNYYSIIISKNENVFTTYLLERFRKALILEKSFYVTENITFVDFTYTKK